MTTMTKELVLFQDGPQQAVFDVDECKDIATHGMAQGVPMFIYSHNNWEWFNENSSEIESLLTDWLYDNGLCESLCSYFGKTSESVLDLKEQLVWAYVEIKCADFLVDNDIDY